MASTGVFCCILAAEFCCNSKEIVEPFVELQLLERCFQRENESHKFLLNNFWCFD